MEYLRYQIAREIGLTQDWPVVIVGIGNLGHALANYSGFCSRGFRIVALLDADPTRTGEVVGRPEDPRLRRARGDRARARGRDRRDRHPRRAPRRTSATGWSRPASRSILNFAPTVLSVPDEVDVRKVDLSIELQILAYHEQRKAAPREARRAVRMRHPTKLLAALRLRGGPDERPGRGHLPQERPGGGPRAARARRPRRRPSSPATWSTRSTCSEATVLATCNRVEIYAEVDRFHGSVEAVSRLLCEQRRRRTRRSSCRTSTCTTTTAPSPTCSTSRPGLDSMVVGESQILGQVREALRVGQEQRHRRPGAQRAVPAGAAGRQARRTRRPTSTASRPRWSPRR